MEVDRVSASLRAAMLTLYSQYYDHVVAETFERDLSEKEWVIILCDDAQQVVGFSTLQLLTIEIRRQTHRFLFSGDTVVDESSRMSPALSGSFGHILLRMMAQYGEQHLHWFLISKGFRTYRFLPVFFVDFYPVCNKPTPMSVAHIMATVAREKFGEKYDESRGVVQMGGKGDWLNERCKAIPEYRLKDPHVAFFLERNPGYVLGDQLVCLADITHANLNRFARRVIEQTEVEWDE